MNKIFRKFLKLLILALMISSAQGVSNAEVFTPAGAVNTHDLDIIRQQQQLQREQKDIDKIREKRNKKKETKDIFPEIIEDKKGNPQIKAKISEFDTKGVYIDRVEFSTSEIFTPDELKKFAENIEKKNIFIQDALDTVDKINRAYAERGYVTARAFLKPQTIDNEVLQIELVEGRVGKVEFAKAKWTRESFIKNRISAKEGDLFDIAKFESDLVTFNKANDGIKLKADLFPGKTEGTTDITIRPTETFPFRITGLMDNAGRDTIGVVRGGLMLQADSLFGFRDKLMLGAYASRSSITPFADYNIPVNKYDGRLGFSFSSSVSSVTSGPMEMFNIKSRSENYSVYYSHPLVRKPNFELTGVVSGNYKKAITSFDNYDLDMTKIASAQVALYGRYDTERGVWYVSQSAYQAFPFFDENSKYFKYEGSLVRLHDFGHGIIGQFRANYQITPQDEQIPYADQFQAGGISTVRGYTEGLLIGMSGYYLSAEAMFPILPEKISYVSKKTQEKKSVPFLGKWVKGAVFVDHAAVFPYKAPGMGNYGRNDVLLSTGLGLRVALPGDLSARIYWGFPLLYNDYESDFYVGRLHFELSLTPDFYGLMTTLRKRKTTETL